MRVAIDEKVAMKKMLHRKWMKGIERDADQSWRKIPPVSI